MRRLFATGRIFGPDDLHHASVAAVVEVQVADEAAGHKLRGRQTVPKRLYPEVQREATGYQIERMLREAASIVGQEWK